MLDHANLDAMTAIMVESMAMDSSDHCLLFRRCSTSTPFVRASCRRCAGAQMSMLEPVQPGRLLRCRGEPAPDLLLGGADDLLDVAGHGPRGCRLSSVRLGIWRCRTGVEGTARGDAGAFRVPYRGGLRPDRVHAPRRRTPTRARSRRAPSVRRCRGCARGGDVTHREILERGGGARS